MNVVFAEAQLAHAPAFYLSRGAVVGYPESPERATCLLAAAEAAGLDAVAPPDYGLAFAARVHTPRYLAYLEHAHARWSELDGGDEVIPNVHPVGGNGTYPDAPVGRAGWHHFDTSAPITADTWRAALWSAHSAAHAATLVADGAAAAYALCRPPGHHCGRETAGGFCYFSNAAIAAEALLTQHKRVAVLDVDVHHGNGTQDVFYRRDDVLTVSLHADPRGFYPFYWGYADERGDGDGDGSNFNLPLPRGTGDDAYLAALGDALGRIADFDPGALVVALGLDTHADDPYQGFALTTAGLNRVGAAIGEAGWPTALVQEGGYLGPALGQNLIAFLDGFRSAHTG